MAKWPTTRNAYPVAPKAYPVLPSAYPGTSIKSFPTGIPPEPSGTLNAASGPATTSFTGTVASGLVTAQLDFDPANAVVTLSVTMRASGTTPPAVLLAAGTGSLTFAAGLCPGFWVDILPGALTFDLSFDSGSTVTFAAQTIPVGGGNYTIPSGTYAGMIITFPNATYNADNLYEGTVNTMLSSEGNAYTFTTVNASYQPVFRKAAVTPDAKDALFFNGGLNQMLCADAGAAALLVDDPALTVFGRIAYNTVDASTAWLTAGRSDDPTNRYRRFGQFTTGTGRERHSAINDAVASTDNTCTTDPLTGGTAAHTVCWYFPGSNGGANINVNGTDLALTLATCNIGTNTVQRIAVSGECSSTPSLCHVGYIYRIVVFSSNLSVSDRNNWFTEIAS